MKVTWRTIIWQQFGAAIDMLDNALRACPDYLWRESLELQLYSMRHVQEHASQLSLLLGRKVGSAPDWVSRAETELPERPTC